MSTAIEYDSDASILDEVLDLNSLTLSREHAQWLLSLNFSERQRSRITALLEKGNDGTLSAPETEELDRFLRIGTMLNLLRAKADLSLQQSSQA